MIVTIPHRGEGKPARGSLASSPAFALASFGARSQIRSDERPPPPAYGLDSLRPGSRLAPAWGASQLAAKKTVRRLEPLVPQPGGFECFGLH